VGGRRDLVRHAESFGAQGHRVREAGELLPVLREALAADGVSIISYPVTTTKTTGSGS
jgi:acetolactate synthase-1/2/3 large subunit